MSCPDAVPEVWQAELDSPTLRQLFIDLAQVARVLEVRLKPVAGAHSKPEPEPSVKDALSRARLFLEAGTLAGVQVLYVHEGVAWMDTLMRHPGGVRLIRTYAQVELPPEEAPDPSAAKGPGPSPQLCATDLLRR